MLKTVSAGASLNTGLEQLNPEKGDSGWNSVAYPSLLRTRWVGTEAGQILREVEIRKHLPMPSLLSGGGHWEGREVGHQWGVFSAGYHLSLELLPDTL